MSSSPAGLEQLRGQRVLVVEDEPAIAMLLEDMLEDLGCSLVGSAASIERALTLIESHPIDLGLLDVNVAGQPIYPVVEKLAVRGVPFVFSTGYGAGNLDERYRDRPVLPKPFMQADLERSLLAALRPPS